MSWIKKRTGPVAVEVDCEGMQAKTAADKFSISYFGATEGDSWAAFLELAKDPAFNEKATFYHTTDKECAAHYGASESGVALTRTFDEPTLAYSGFVDFVGLAKWAKAASVPTLINFSEDFIEPIFAEHNPALILFTEEEGQEWQATFAQAAADLKGEVLFVTSGVTDGIQARLAEFIGVGAEDMPTMRLISPSDQMLKYVYEGAVAELTGEKIAAYVQDFKDEKLQPHLKSEEIPEDVEGEHTKVVVGKNWNDVVMNQDHDVLVKYYAPWCGHCKALAPTWDQLAADVADIPDLVVAKFDATANEVAGLDIRGYPTLKFYAKGSAEGVDYNGGRELDDFKTWFAENSEAYKAARPGAHEDL